MQRGALEKAAAAALRWEADEGEGFAPQFGKLLQADGVLEYVKVGEALPCVPLRPACRSVRQRRAEAEVRLKIGAVIACRVDSPVDELAGADGGDPFQELRACKLRGQQVLSGVTGQRGAHLLQRPAAGRAHIGGFGGQRHHVEGGGEGAQRTVHLQRGQDGGHEVVAAQIRVIVQIRIEILQIGGVRRQGQTVQVQYVRAVTGQKLGAEPVVGVVPVVVHHDLAVTVGSLELVYQLVQLIRAEGGGDVEGGLGGFLRLPAAPQQQGAQQGQKQNGVFFHGTAPLVRYFGRVGHGFIVAADGVNATDRRSRGRREREKAGNQRFPADFSQGTDVPQGYLFRFAPLRGHPPLRTF